MAKIPVYIEASSKRVFACALDWPGWCRSAKAEAEALAVLVDYGPRYRRALARSAKGFEPPGEVSDLRVSKRLSGDASTDFGVPGKWPPSDEGALGPAEVERLRAILRAAWKTFDSTAAKAEAEGVALRKGPRGGGRGLDAIVRHVLDAEAAYEAKLGGNYRRLGDATDVAAQMAAVRTSILDLVASRARGETPPRTPRSGGLWPPRYGVRRSAWHALDHAWEIEDRSTPAA